MPASSLQTSRLLLRKWRAEDLPLFAKLNANPEVMKHFPATLSQEESDQLARSIQKEMREKPYGLWAVEIPQVAPFIGFVGLHEVGFAASFTPAIEIGWRIDAPYWGKGYATEAANHVLGYAFQSLQLEKLVSFTAKLNTRSMKLMERIGLRYKCDFEHPKLEPGHPLRSHVLYQLTKAEYQKLAEEPLRLE